MFLLRYILTAILLLLPSPITALPEPPPRWQQRHPYQVGFVIPPNSSPPYGKSLPESSPYSRTWSWTQWIFDAKSSLKCVFGKSTKSRKRPSMEDEERKMNRFENDIVLRVNVTSLADRIAITEIAEVLSL